MHHDARIINSNQRPHSVYFCALEMLRAFRAISGLTHLKLSVLVAFTTWREQFDPESAMHPTVEWLAEETRCSVRSITRALSELESRGLLLRHSKAAPGKAARYSFGPELLKAFYGRLAAHEARRRVPATSATVASVAPHRQPNSQPNVGHSGLRLSTDVVSTPTLNSNNGVVRSREDVADKGDDLRIKGQPLGQASVDELYFVAFEASKARPVLKAAAKVEWQRRQNEPERLPRGMMNAAQTDEYLRRMKAGTKKAVAS